MKDYLKYQKFNINCWSAHSQIQDLVLSGETKFYKYWTEDSLQWKKNISQQPLVRSSQNLKLKFK
jgi:hypothetical protein